MKDTLNSIKIDFCSLGNLANVNLWLEFLSDLELVMGKKLTHLDTHDPVRRQVVSLQSAANYICTFENKEETRWLFGKFGGSNVQFTIAINKEKLLRTNSVSFLLSRSEKNSTKVDELANLIFKSGNTHLIPFYSYADTLKEISGKRKFNRNAVDLEVELGGMFWLTYFNARYLDFFGEAKTEKLEYSSKNSCGASYKFDEEPGTLKSILARKKAEILLGSDTFVDPALQFDKTRGPQALSFVDLLEANK